MDASLWKARGGAGLARAGVAGARRRRIARRRRASLVEEFARRAAIVPIAEVAAACGIALESYAPGRGRGAVARGRAGGRRDPVPAVLEEATRAALRSPRRVRGGRLARAQDASSTTGSPRRTTSWPRAGDGRRAGALPRRRARCGRRVRAAALDRAHARLPRALRGRPRRARRGAEAVDGAACRLARALAAVQCVGSMQQALEHDGRLRERARAVRRRDRDLPGRPTPRREHGDPRRERARPRLRGARRARPRRAPRDARSRSRRRRRRARCPR